MENFNLNSISTSLQPPPSPNHPRNQPNRQNTPKTQQSYMPFLFRSKKHESKDRLSNPAPGQYEIKGIFEHHDHRNELQQKYHLIMQNGRKINQSVFFKSASKRFNYYTDTNHIPITYSTTQQQNPNKSLTNIRSKYKQKKQLLSSIRKNNHRNYYPSIPDCSRKYGYVLGEKGKLDKVGKTEEQLDRDRESMKMYVKNLDGQLNYQIHPLQYIVVHKESPSIAIQKLKKQSTQSLQKTSSPPPSISPTSTPTKSYSHIHNLPKKPHLSHTLKYNTNKINTVLQQKHQRQQYLGPGSYELPYNSFTNEHKMLKFQFFNSTVERFKDMVEISDMKSMLDGRERTKYIDYWKTLNINKRYRFITKQLMQHLYKKQGQMHHYHHIDNTQNNTLKMKEDHAMKLKEDKQSTNKKERQEKYLNKSCFNATQISIGKSKSFNQNSGHSEWKQKNKKKQQMVGNKDEKIGSEYQRQNQKGRGQSVIKEWSIDHQAEINKSPIQKN